MVSILTKIKICVLRDICVYKYIKIIKCVKKNIKILTKCEN